MNIERSMKSDHTIETGFDILVFLAAFILAVEPAIWGIGILIFIDTFTAIWAVLKDKGFDGITSRKAGRIITKIILYPMALICAYIGEHLLAPGVPWLSVTTGIIATVEIKSIFEKMSLLLGYNLWKKIKENLWKAKPDDEDEKPN
jgi:phosphatidylglycerophosphate synthase